MYCIYVYISAIHIYNTYILYIYVYACVHHEYVCMSILLFLVLPGLWSTPAENLSFVDAVINLS